MGELLTFFFMYHFHAEWYWWVAFGCVCVMEAYSKGRRQEKLDEFLNNEKKEYDLKQERRRKADPHIYLGGMMED